MAIIALPLLVWRRINKSKPALSELLILNLTWLSGKRKYGEWYSYRIICRPENERSSEWSSIVMETAVVVCVLWHLCCYFTIYEVFKKKFFFIAIEVFPIFPLLLGLTGLKAPTN